MSQMPARNRTAFWLVTVVATMASLSFAAVPFYSWFCRTTGFAGTTQRAAEAPKAGDVLDQTVRIRFDASREAGMPWEFKAEQTTMTLRIGETGLAFFEAYNPTDHVTAGQASYNVSPDLAGGYFTKIACFCFTEQVLQPHQRVQMPVTFYVDPSIVKDPEAKYIQEITLSYTFHSEPVPNQQASNGKAPDKPIN
jgi:cytochrome c oxidase assembly protein subunit 11